jgi:LAS superfamily LD-carboxypeptidase LdcB/peptidoglycan hydrolase-like protein with peptidoglycan-binding domain
MARLLITENERKEILTKYGIITETTISQLPQDIQTAINTLKTQYSLDITDANIQKELDQEGNFTVDSGGENPQARKQINNLVADAKKVFPKLSNVTGIVSGYRSYMDQVRNFGNKATKRGVDNTQKANTIPGFSQHHTGKAFDIFSVDTSWWNTNSDVKRWVEENCGKYGFKVTYTESGKLRIPEPWHLYYIGGGDDSKSNQTVDNKVDNYYKSSQVNPEFEKKTEKFYAKSGCKGGKNYSESPTFDDIKNGTKVMRIGHKGTPVSDIQTKLLSLNYNLGRCGADGLFGPKTKAAIEALQTKTKLEVSSSVDKNTLEKLNNPDETMKNSTSNPQTSGSTGSGDVILMGGLDYRKGDLSITQQVESLKTTFTGKNIIGFRYNELNKVLNAIKENPNAYVVLFSAGCGYASTISKQMTDKTKLFIVEPYATSSNTAKSVQTAVANGTPSKNVVVGPNSNRGGGVVANATKTPSDLGHWGALKNLGNIIS